MSYLVKFFKLLGTKLNEMLSLGLLMFVRLYQLLLSPYMGGNCRFYPSCSAFATEALQSHNPAKAAYLIVSRIFKCHPWGPSGYDPVPEVLNEQAQ